MNQQSYLLSIIIPVYNTAQYLEETIQSVLHQTIRFENNIQIVLVNNASTDNSGDICHKYQRRFPQNITYVELAKNVGPSGARNAGLPYVRGKYVNFLDSDDKWSRNAFSLAITYLETHPDICFVACRMKYFDAWKGWLHDDWRFVTSKEIDIHLNPQFTQFWIGSVLFRMDKIKDHRFDETAKFAEDMKFINSLLLKHKKYGVLREAVFYYRRRGSGSQVQSQSTNPNWLFEVPYSSYFYLVQLSQHYYNNVIEYVQYLLMQEIVWRITSEDICLSFDKNEKLRYSRIISDMLQHITDEIICLFEYQSYTLKYKTLCLRLKHGSDFESRLTIEHGQCVYDGYDISPLDKAPIITVINHTLREHTTLYLRGYLYLPKRMKADIFIRDQKGNRYSLDITPIPPLPLWGLEEVGLPRYGFTVEISLFENICLDGVLVSKDKVHQLPLYFSGCSRLDSKMTICYCVQSKHILQAKNGKLTVTKQRVLQIVKREMAVLFDLLRNGRKRAFCYRLVGNLSKLLAWRKKPIWIFLSNQPKTPFSSFISYCKNKKSQDVKLVAADAADLQYKFAFLRAECVISDLSQLALLNPFLHHSHYLKDLFPSKFVYLTTIYSHDRLLLGSFVEMPALWIVSTQEETEKIQTLIPHIDPNIFRIIQSAHSTLSKSELQDNYSTIIYRAIQELET